MPYQHFHQIREAVLRRIDKKGHFIRKKFKRFDCDGL
ncbi:hypothetical protein HDEF_1265 [Candidatus Hamiltonella defensa 5AT (Acyrthosiphon pisum)]|uniref:Uncharacterized protein n=1 Tax=Hamiltonella defensa subsp. Acyrthosiphon pisum (strain 5AT) TaxID=572265 RepID=C4K5S5_HAMD5|nr:hypothetical protein HDEF_1265 [Candidatus Hamiltonella defensa 5AT (Acyrthosiphon pisum)]